MEMYAVAARKQAKCEELQMMGYFEVDYRLASKCWICEYDMLTSR